MALLDKYTSKTTVNPQEDIGIVSASPVEKTVLTPNKVYDYGVSSAQKKEGQEGEVAKLDLSPIVPIVNEKVKEEAIVSGNTPQGAYASKINQPGFLDKLIQSDIIPLIAAGWAGGQIGNQGPIGGLGGIAMGGGAQADVVNKRNMEREKLAVDMWSGIGNLEEQKRQFDTLLPFKNKSNVAGAYKLPAQQAVDLGNKKASISQLDTLMAKVPELPDSLFDPIKGTVLKYNPYSKSAQSFNQLVASTKQVIGKGLEGGVLRKEDEVKYEKIIPKIGDTREILESKAQQLRAMLEDSYSSSIDALDSAGYDVSRFAPESGKEYSTKKAETKTAETKSSAPSEKIENYESAYQPKVKFLLDKISNGTEEEKTRAKKILENIPKTQKVASESRNPPFRDQAGMA